MNNFVLRDEWNIRTWATSVCQGEGGEGYVLEDSVGYDRETMVSQESGSGLEYDFGKFRRYDFAFSVFRLDARLVSGRSDEFEHAAGLLLDQRPRGKSERRQRISRQDPQVAVLVPEGVFQQECVFIQHITLDLRGG